MKTAMQELLESYERSANQYLEMKQINKASLYFSLAMCIKEDYLEKEKEQIINDYGKGKVDLFMFYKDLGPDKTTEQYYNQTYNQNK